MKGTARILPRSAGEVTPKAAEAKAHQHNFASGKHFHCIFFSGSRKNPCILKDVLPSVMMLIFLENLVRHTSLGRKGQS